MPAFCGTRILEVITHEIVVVMNEDKWLSEIHVFKPVAFFFK
jgi:hypothetical protein